MTIFIDGGCPFCRWGAKKFRRALRVRADIEHAQNHPAMHALMREQNSWILQTDHGDLYFGFAAITYAVAHSGRRWIRWFAPLLRLRPVQRIGQAFYELVTVSRPVLSRLVPATA